MASRPAQWTNGKTTRSGSWEYYWPGDFFWVWFGNAPARKVYGDSPEWGDWKLVREEKANG